MQDLDLLSSRGLVIVQSVHLVVVHLHVTSQICAFALINGYFLSLLGVFHFQLPYAILDRRQFSFFFFDHPVCRFNLIIYGSVVALHGALQLNTLRSIDLE